jgi:glycosyltransferase involved in cell wall biosynthesis
VRIVHINLERGWYGGERQTLYLMEGLRSLGHENTLLARENEIFVRRVREKGFPVRILGKPFLLHGRLLREFDVVHAHEKRGLQLAALWKRFHGRPIVYTRRVDYVPGRHLTNRFMYRKMDLLVAISDKIREIMIAWGTAPDRIRVIRSTVPFERAVPAGDSEGLRKRFSGKKVVGCVASLVAHKDHHTLLEAAAIISGHRDDVVFLLLGDGELRPELEGKAASLRLRNIVFEGYQDNPYPYFPIFDIFTLTSREEGLGSSILDAFLYQVPVVATAAGGIPELVKDRDTGLLAAVGDPVMVAQHLEEMLDDDELRRRCTRNAYDLLKREFTIETMARSYESVYREVSDVNIRVPEKTMRQHGES